MKILPCLILVLAMAKPPTPEVSRDPEILIPTPFGKAQREKVVAVAKSALGWREATGNNDGPEIDRILAAVGMEGTGAPYCAAFCVWSYKEAGMGNKIPASAWSPDLVRDPTWARGKGETPKPADVGGLYFPSKGRIAHVFIIEKWGNGMAVTIEGNTTADASSGSERDREGEGVYRRWRLTSTISCVKSYL